MNKNELANKIHGIASGLQKSHRPGLLESTCKECLAYDLIRSGHCIENEKSLPLIYHEIKLSCGYRIDTPAENKAVIEIKSIDSLNDIHLARNLTYIKPGNFEPGLLLNFNVTYLKNGIRRIIKGYIRQ